MIVDAHTHRYPDEVIQDPETYANQAKEFHWLGLVMPEQGASLQGWANRRQMLADMDNAGVDKAVLLGWYWENPDSCILHNDWHA
ncbi:MAG TPA: amidohydrolase, partial [Opitutae bacterium]|nr:amidohydrolase [Opitutae bacterium]